MGAKQALGRVKKGQGAVAGIFSKDITKKIARAKLMAKKAKLKAKFNFKKD